MIDLKILQNEIGDWVECTFGRQTSQEKLLALTKEVGGLAHLKLEEIVPLLHTFRQLGYLCDLNDNHTHDEKIKLSLGYIMIHLLDYCSLRGWDYEEILNNTWEELRQREWEENPTGLATKKESTS